LLARVATHATLSQLSRGLLSALDDHGRRLQQANRRLRELNVEMATLEEGQRRRLAQELHDTAIQDLVLARVLLEGDSDVAQRRMQLIELVARSIRQLRSLVFELSPPLLRNGKLYPSLEWLAEQVHQKWGLAVVCERDGELPTLGDACAVTLFQGTRELLINAAKHAEARVATLTVRCDAELLHICVTDDGRGFDAATLDRLGAGATDSGYEPGTLAATQLPGQGSGGGFGLYSLRSRIELLGGALMLRNGRPRGAEACLSIGIGAAAAGKT
jgi:signal transduction histidine kinase